MEANIKLWVLGGVLAVIISVLGFILAVIGNKMLKRLDEIVAKLTQLDRISAIQEQQILQLQERNKEFVFRLNNHADRLHDVELHAFGQSKTEHKNTQ